MQTGVCPSGVRIGLYRPGNLGGRRAAMMASGLMALLLTLLAIVPSQRSATAHLQAAGVKGATAVARLEALPLQAQSVISGALGAGAAAFAAEPRPGGYELAGGGVAANLNGREVAVQVSGGTLSLALSGVGRGVRLAAAGRVSPAANANRVTYRRAGVQEWYAAGPLGIEQGFTLMRRPAGRSGPVTLALRLGGSLRAQLAGSQVQFLASSGGVQARYGGLTAVDASGRRLPTTLGLQGGRLVLRVSDGGAHYPLRIDPLIQQGPKLAASDETGHGLFGWSVAVSADGNTALIGGPYDNNQVGAAWVFTRSGGTWAQQGPKLTASDETGTGEFGWSVALSADGNTALIGGLFDTSGRGAAWVFTRSGGTWTQQGPKLTASDETGSGDFGHSVALSADGSTALIGGPSDNFGGVGAAWVFTRSGGTWTQQGPKLTASDETGTSDFGVSAALSADGNTALVGGSADNNLVGAAWVFTRSGGTWTQQGPKLIASDETGTGQQNGGGQFGSSVAVSADGDTALIGGPDDVNSAGVGAAWVFTRSGGTWTQQGPKLIPSDGQGQFGWSVALSADGSTALIGGIIDNGGVGAAWVFGPLLVGSSQIEPNVDSNPAGTAEAFRYTAAGTGSTGKLSIYLDSNSTATKVIIGLYTNTSAGNPGVLLTSGTITNPTAGAWNTVTIPATGVTAGTDYWLAVLTPVKAGTIRFRDLPDGTGGSTQTSAQKSLMSMPSSWKTGTRFANSPASLFAAP
jgi:FG-GAP repeat